MRYRLTIVEPDYDGLIGHLLQGDVEEVAILYGHEWSIGDTHSMLVSSWEPVPTQALLRQRRDIFSVDSGYIVSRVKKARMREESIVLAHSHPGDPCRPRFSLADDLGEDDLYPLLTGRIPGRVHGALIVSPGGATARFCLPNGMRVSAAEVRVVGRRIVREIAIPETMKVDSDEAHARQQLIWGSHGQRLLHDAVMAVIGAGGTGSVVAQQLIHLGVGTLIVADNQLVERSNLSRIVGANLEDVGTTWKVDVVQRTGRAVDSDVEVRTLRGNVASSDILVQLKEADLIFGCTDSHHSRAVINAFAVQYAIPFIDLGFNIDVNLETRRIASATGEVRIVVPGGYCLSCAGVLNADRIMAEKATPAERSARPGYFVNLDIDDPSVITLNSTIASLSATIGCDMLVPTMQPVSSLDSYRYNARKGLVKHEAKQSRPHCGICGVEGRAKAGDSLPLPG